MNRFYKNTLAMASANSYLPHKIKLDLVNLKANKKGKQLGMENVADK